MEQDTNNRLYVGNLPYTLSDQELAQLFAEFGEVSDAKVITDKFNGRSKGFGFVTMADTASVEKAIAAMNGKDTQGRPLVVNVARPMKPREDR